MTIPRGAAPGSEDFTRGFIQATPEGFTSP
jgi:hypothetical protein